MSSPQPPPTFRQAQCEWRDRLIVDKLIFELLGYLNEKSRYVGNRVFLIL
jgi:hypothetical protein